MLGILLGKLVADALDLCVQLSPLLMCDLALLLYFEKILLDLFFVLIFCVVQFRGLSLNGGNLRVQDELLTNDIELDLVDLLLLLLKVFPHLHVLLFQQ